MPSCLPKPAPRLPKGSVEAPGLEEPLTCQRPAAAATLGGNREGRARRGRPRSPRRLVSEPPLPTVGPHTSQNRLSSSADFPARLFLLFLAGPELPGARGVPLFPPRHAGAGPAGGATTYPSGARAEGAAYARALSTGRRMRGPVRPNSIAPHPARRGRHRVWLRVLLPRQGALGLAVRSAPVPPGPDRPLGAGPGRGAGCRAVPRLRAGTPRRHVLVRSASSAGCPERVRDPRGAECVTPLPAPFCPRGRTHLATGCRRALGRGREIPPAATDVTGASLGLPQRGSAPSLAPASNPRPCAARHRLRLERASSGVSGAVKRGRM